MARESEKTAATPPVSPDRLWAEQLAMGMALLVGVLIFMALFHPKLLSAGGSIFGPNYMEAYGWMSVLGVFLHLVMHEVGTLAVAWRLGLRLRFRAFAFGSNATAILEDLPRRTWMDAVVGLAGPVTGTLVSALLVGIYHFTDNPFFLGMACVGCLYNLFTLIPILDLEGGWIAPAIAPQAWFLGLVICAFELEHGFNLILLGVFSFAVPRFVLLLRARMPRTDLACTTSQRVIVGVLYFLLVLALAWFGSASFEWLAKLVPEAMGD